MIKVIDTDREGEHIRSLTADYYRELCRRELLASDKQLRSVLATLHKPHPKVLGRGGVQYV